MTREANLWGAIRELEAEAVLSVERGLDARFRMDRLEASVLREQTDARETVARLRDRVAALEAREASRWSTRLARWFAARWPFPGGLVW